MRSRAALAAVGLWVVGFSALYWLRDRSDR